MKIDHHTPYNAGPCSISGVSLLRLTRRRDRAKPWPADMAAATQTLPFPLVVFFSRFWLWYSHHRQYVIIDIIVDRRKALGRGQVGPSVSAPARSHFVSTPNVSSILAAHPDDWLSTTIISNVSPCPFSLIPPFSLLFLFHLCQVSVWQSRRPCCRQCVSASSKLGHVDAQPPTPLD